MPVRYRYNSKNKRVAINTMRSTLMKRVMQHTKNKKRNPADAKAAAKALRLTLKRGVTKSGRRIKRKSPSGIKRVVSKVVKRVKKMF